jgi:enoyl-CoA hydratase/carnithine racemase
VSSDAAVAPDDQVLSEQRNGVLWVTFNRPEARNAMTFAMYERLTAICDAVAADAGIRCVVFAGAGEKAFVAGTDIAQFRAFKQPADALAYEERIETVLSRIEEIGVPTIAAIRGACTGGGAGIAAACDLRIASPSARFGVPIARTLGNCLSVGNLRRLTALVGPAAVKDLLFTGRLIDAPAALQIGFVGEVTADDAALLERAQELSATIAANAPITLAATKQAMLRIARAQPLPDGSDLIVKTYMSADFREGIEAFFEKRTARWTGV